ncbi:MAG: hypothetical protein ACLSVG_08680 [Clostridia bacterium]
MAAIVSIVIRNWTTHIDLEKVSYIKVSIRNYAHDKFEITENLERSLRKEAHSNRFLKGTSWYATFDCHGKDQSIESGKCSGDLNFDEAGRLIREFLEACPAG